MRKSVVVPRMRKRNAARRDFNPAVVGQLCPRSPPSEGPRTIRRCRPRRAQSASTPGGAPAAARENGAHPRGAPTRSGARQRPNASPRKPKRLPVGARFARDPRETRAGSARGAGSARDPRGIRARTKGLQHRLSRTRMRTGRGESFKNRNARTRVFGKF